MVLVMCIPVTLPADLQLGALATHDILKTGVDQVTVTQATLGLAYLAWYSLIFGDRSSHASPRTKGPSHIHSLLPSLCISVLASSQLGVSPVRR